MEEKKKKEVIRTLKYLAFTFSAGAIQFCSTWILSAIWPKEVFANGPVVFYLIGLLLSVIWNLTLNRKFTFKSAANLPLAMLETIAFYVVFAPASCFLQAWLTNGVLIEGWDGFVINPQSCLGLPTMVGTIICMVVNLLLEFPYQRFIVFGRSIDTAKSKKAKKEENKKENEKQENVQEEQK